MLRPHDTPDAGARDEGTWYAPAWTPLAFAAGVALLILLVVLISSASAPAPTRSSATARSGQVHLALDILPVRPLGPAVNWPAYTPSTELRVPANSVVTVTIRNFDLGAAPLTPNSPFAHVQGTLAGSASADGRPYAALDPSHVAHTFTIAQLHVNVPIPADAAPGQTFVTVTFSFRTGPTDGTYTWRCNAPCGTGDGYQGPMRTPGYMVGTLMAHGCCCC